MKKIVCMAVLGLVCAPAFATNYTWSNALDDNDFSQFGNWTAVPTTFTGHTFWVDSVGDDRAVLSTDLPGQPKNILVAHTYGKTGEMLVSGGNNSLGASCALRVGVASGTTGASSTGTFTMTNGTLSVMDGYTTFADGGTGLRACTATVDISGGVLNTDRITIAQYLGDTGTLNMTGGTINLSLGDVTPTSTGGSIRSGAGTATLNISGDAVLNTLKLGLASGLSIKMNGGAINVLGFMATEDYQAAVAAAGGTFSNILTDTFDFTEASIAAGTMLGKIEFNAGLFKVTGDFESLLDAAIASGNIYTTVAGKTVDAQFADGFTTLLLVPEPMTLVILGVGSLFLRRRK